MISRLCSCVVSVTLIRVPDCRVMAVGCVLKENGEKGMTFLLIQLPDDVEELECFAVANIRILSCVPLILYCGFGTHSRHMHEFLTTEIVFVLILYVGAILRVIVFLRWALQLVCIRSHTVHNFSPALFLQNCAYSSMFQNW